MKNKAGFTLVAAIFILLVMTLLAVTTSTFISSDAVIAVKNYYSQDAFYIASSGMEYYMKQLDEDPDWSSPPANKIKNFSGGQFVITTTNESKNRITFTIAGLVTVEGDTYKRMIRPTIQRTAGGLSDILGEYVLYGGIGDGTFIDNNATIIGDIFVNSDLIIGANVNVSGDAVSTGTIDTGAGSGVDGTTEAGVEPPYTPPTLETTYYDNLIATAATYPSGNQIYNSTTFSGITYINGDVTFDISAVASVTGTATLVATGKVSLKNNVVTGDNLHVIAGGQVTMANNVILGKDQIWYSSIGFDIGNNAAVADVDIGEGTQFITPGDITFGNNIEFYGFIYCGGDFTQTGNNFYFEGNILVGGDLNVDENTTLVLNDTLVDASEIIGVTNGEEGEESFEVEDWDEVY